MNGLEFCAKDVCYQKKAFKVLTETYCASFKGYITFEKWIAICKNNPLESIHSLFKDWNNTSRFESMLKPFIYPTSEFIAKAPRGMFKE